MIATDPDFTVTIWNPGAERLYGHSAKEMLGRPTCAIAPLSAGAGLARLQRELTESGHGRVELVTRRRDGICLDIEVMAVAVRARPAGELIGYLAIHRDVTRRRWLERERRRLLAVLENSTDFIGLADLDGRPTYVNPAGRRLVGLEPGVEVESTTLEDYVAPERRERVLTELVPGVKRDGRRSWELDFAHMVTGERIPVSWDGFRVDDPITGEPIAMATITRDLTEVRRHEAALRASEHRLEVVVEGVTDAFYVFDEDLRCAHLNARALVLLADLTGRSLTREDLVGRAVADVLPGFAGSDVEAQVLTAAHEQQTVLFELPVGDRWFHVPQAPPDRSAQDRRRVRPRPCGHCWSCDQHLFSLCDNTNPNPEMQIPALGQPTGGIYGYTHAFGGYAGSHAEYMRLVHADQNCFHVPENVGDEQALFLSDAAPTGFMGADFAEPKGGDTIAAWGCGGVGLMAQRARSSWAPSG